MRKAKIGIYEIRNTWNNKTYVGSTCNLGDRWSTHKYLLNKGSHHCLALQRAWLKYGANSFQYNVLEIFENKENLLEKEQIYLDKAINAKASYNSSRITNGVSRYDSPRNERLSVLLPDEIDEILTLYCQDSGASKTGAIVMLIKTLEKRLTPESKQLLANGRKESAVN